MLGARCPEEDSNFQSSIRLDSSLGFASADKLPLVSACKDRISGRITSAAIPGSGLFIATILSSGRVRLELFLTNGLIRK